MFGEDVSSASPEQLQRMRNHWGMLFQQGALYSALTVFDNIAQPLRELRALPEDVIRDAVLLKMNMVGLGPADANKMPSDLSGGMIKRAALARALALEPQLLFLDEPTAGLDPDLSDAFVELIQSLHHELGLTVVMVTHDLDTLFALSTRASPCWPKSTCSRSARRATYCAWSIPSSKTSSWARAASAPWKYWKNATQERNRKTDMENRSYALMTGFFTVALLVAAILIGLWFNRDRTKLSPYGLPPPRPFPA